MTQNYHTPIAIDAPATAATLRAPFEELDAALGRAIGSGTSFPVSPTEGDRFWRTDLNAEFVYNGTAWQGEFYFPVRAAWFHFTNWPLSGNTLSVSDRVAQSQTFGFVAAQPGAADGNSTTNSAVLDAGAYTIRTLGESGSGYGKCDIAYKHMDDAVYTDITTGQDWYSGAQVQNIIKTATFTLSKPGRYVFRFLINGKHASSSGYALSLTHIDIYLTAGDA